MKPYRTKRFFWSAAARYLRWHTPQMRALKRYLHRFNRAVGAP